MSTPIPIGITYTLTTLKRVSDIITHTNPKTLIAPYHARHSMNTVV